MKSLMSLVSALALQLFITEASLACKTTSYAHSGMKIQGVVDYLLKKSAGEVSSYSMIKNIRIDDSGVIAEILDKNGNCSANLYQVDIQANCSTEVTEISTYEEIDCL